MKKLILLPILAGLAAISIPSAAKEISTKAEGTVTTYLVLSSIGTYSGSEEVGDVPELFLENTITYVATAGSALPGADKIGVKGDSEGIFTSWVSYEHLGAPTKYTTVPKEDGKILYAFFSRDTAASKALTNLYYEGTPEKTTYDTDVDSAFDPTGITVYAQYDDSSKADVTSSVTWSALKVGATSVTGTYTYKGVTKTVTVDGLTITGTKTDETIYLVPNMWSNDSAWFAAYCWDAGGNSTWFKLEKDGDKYSTEIDTETYVNIIFTRMDPAKATLDWSSKWNQTNDLTFDGNCYTITDWGGLDGKSVGTWSTIN